MTNPFENKDAYTYHKDMNTDAFDLNSRFTNIKKELKEKYPKMDDGWINWWAWKLSILTYGGARDEGIEITFEGEPDKDPIGCTIKLSFDYGS